jgi:hypothetical protein
MNYCDYRNAFFSTKIGDFACRDCRKKILFEEPRECVPGPGFVSKALNFAIALFGHASDGLAEVSEEEYKNRVATCAGCDRLTVDSTCSHPSCGCDVRKKAWWRSEDCPEKKWGLDVVTSAPSGSSGCGCGT